jgi:hypothetical protein
MLLRSQTLEPFSWIRARRTLLPATRWMQTAEQWRVRSPHALCEEEEMPPC